MNINLIIESLKNKEVIDSQDIDKLVNYIVEEVKASINDLKMINKCDAVQGLIGTYLNDLGIPNYPCITNKSIREGIVGHSFIVADFKEYGGGVYLIDPAFIQFYYLNDEMDDMYINNIRVKSKSPYYYANKIDSNLLNSLITKGYLELNEESAYFYGNSFYYTLVGIIKDYKIIPIPGSVYLNSFFKGKETLNTYDYDLIKISGKSKC